MSDQRTDELNASGVYIIEVIRDGKNGPEVLERRVVPNLVVNTGKRQLWRMSSGLSSKVFTKMRIGTSGVAASSAQTNVVSPVTGTLANAAVTLLSSTRTMQWIVSYASGVGTKSATNIREVVVLNQATSPGGSALSRSVFSAVNKSTSDKLKITYRCRLT